jgi:hypothetical protein
MILNIYYIPLLYKVNFNTKIVNNIICIIILTDLNIKLINIIGYI